MGSEGFKGSATPLTSRDAWDDPQLVAEQLGFKYTPQFCNAVEQIRNKLVKDARIMEYLPIIAIGILSRVQPPLERENVSNQIMS